METSNLDISRKRNHQEEEQLPEHLECPRCGSSNTKFCYYNNYNKSQPRHFCKGCKRHWTKGGTLRNVPLGGGRKNKRQKPSNSATPKNISHVSSINNHTVPMTSSDDSLIFSKIGDTNDGMINNFIENDTFLGGDHGMFFLGSSHQDQTKQFSCSENGDFGSILPSFVPNIHSLDEYGYTQMPDSSFESTITTTMPVDGNNILSQKPWGVSFGSGSMDLSSLWDWNEINSLVSADLNIPWEEDAEIKF